MHTVRQQIGELELVLQCRPDLAPQASWVLENFKATGVQLRDGMQVGFGWSELFARSDPLSSTRLIFYEPDFDRDPMRDLRPDVSCTLDLQSTQLWMARETGTRFTPCNYRERLAVSGPTCLSKKCVTLYRTAQPRFENDSGWLISSDAPEGQPQVLFMHELMKLRPALVQVLGLPPEFIAKFRGDILDGVGGPK